MGIWVFIGSTAEAVKRNAPDATPVKNACTIGASALTKTAEIIAPPVKIAYSTGAAAIIKTAEVVAPPVKNVCADVYTTGAAAVTKTAEVIAPPVKNACTNAYSSGAAAFTKIRELTPDDETKSKIGMYTTKFAKNAGAYALQEGYKSIPGGVAFNKIISQTINEVDKENKKLEKLKAASPQEHLNGGKKLIDEAASKGSLVSEDRSPEDVIRVFMMKEFIGTRFFDDLMVHELASKKAKKPE